MSCWGVFVTPTRCRSLGTVEVALSNFCSPGTSYIPLVQQCCRTRDASLIFITDTDFKVMVYRCTRASHGSKAFATAWALARAVLTDLTFCKAACSNVLCSTPFCKAACSFCKASCRNTFCFTSSCQAALAACFHSCSAANSSCISSTICFNSSICLTLG